MTSVHVFVEAGSFVGDRLFHGLIVRVDILLIYAILGFVLVLMYKWPTKLLAGITLFLFLGGDTCPGSL
ncbi:MAG: hypothetical protein ACLR6J_12420 [Parabacteroides merdae]